MADAPITHPDAPAGPGLTAVVGAGVAGLATAVRLAEAGRRVAVFDPSPRPGGLAGGFDVGGGSVERFYHHIFRSDQIAQRWIADLGLAPRLEFLPATMGFYSGGRLLPFGTALSLLRFTPLPLRDRIRLGLRVRSLARTLSPDAFENITALDWLKARCSVAELEVFWIPLLKAKFGPDLDKVSMAWLWARFRARVGGSSGGRERLGYLRGGFQQLADALAERARSLGVEVHLGSAAEAVLVDEGGVSGLRVAGHGEVACEALVWTPSLAGLVRAVPTLPAAYRAACGRLQYHHAVVMVVELADSVLPCYWTTVGDDRLPFTVAVEHTRLVGTADYGNRTVVYLGRYAAPSDPLVTADESEVRRIFLESAAEHFHPGFATPLAAHVFRAPAAQPIVPPGWAAGRPALRTGVRGLVVANMAQIYPWDRGVNYSLDLGEQAAGAVLDELAEVTLPEARSHAELQPVS